MPAQQEAGPISWPDSVGPMWSKVPCLSTLPLVIPLLRAAAETPVLIFEDGTEVTGGAILDGTARFAAHLERRVKPGDRVIMAIGNRAEFFIAWLAVLANRSIPVVINPDVGPTDARHIAVDSGAVLAIAEGPAVDVLEQVDLGQGRRLTVVSLHGAEPDGLDHLGDIEPFDLDAVDADVREPAGIHYTSGTTGSPKGCVHDHTQYPRYADIGLRLYPYNESDRILNPLQFYYGDSVWLWIIALKLGAKFISVRKFSVSRFWSNVHQFDATMFFGIGAIPSLLLTAPPSELDRENNIRFAMQIGVPAAQHRELVDRYGFPWVEGYGMAETGVSICMPVESSNDYIGTGAIGIPVPEVQVALTDESGREIDGAGTGQLAVHTPDMMLGYFNLPEATAEVLQDGWLKSGDLVRRDENGVFYFVGRTKLIIRRGGENIAPEEVEAVLRLHPSVVDAAVVAVEDGIRGEEAKAYIQLEEGAPFEPEKLVQFCAEQLAAFKVPRYFEPQETPFPRTPSMRIQKSELKVDGAHRVDRAWDKTKADT